MLLPRFRRTTRELLGFVSSACLALGWCISAQADDPEPPFQPAIAGPSNEGRQAIRSLRIPAGLRVDLFAAEPMLANPVAFCVDEHNRFYVVETFRLHAGVTDTRDHMNWLDDDLACRTVADRVAMYRKHLSPADFASYGTQHDRVRLIEDRDGDGRADHSTVFADGFHSPADGLAAGILARRGAVWFTCIPDLWSLRDTDGDGRADQRRSLHSGYGVHVGFLGHDLHGLRFGPDGRLYFSMGDRGTNVKSADRAIFLPDTGAVFRCEPDGSNLEVFASGLRNPQELAFDAHGNLFTVDNNSDGGDRARLVHIVEGGDSGWRIGYQFIERPNLRGPWNAEKLWRPLPENTAAYLLPPLANFTDGPSGLTINPGSTLLPERFRDHFFICDFRGSPGQSGVRSFAVKPRGASFEPIDQAEFIWGLEATDVDFGTDGALYISDWVEGWRLTGKGRLFKVTGDVTPAQRESAGDVQRLLASGELEASPTDRAITSEVRLIELLDHPDQRVRQEAQFALAARGMAAVEKLASVAGGSLTARAEKPRAGFLSRLHAIWALGQIGRKEPKALEPLAKLCQDRNAEVRAQVARVWGDAAGHWPDGTVAHLVAMLRDDRPRVRFFAALALGKTRANDAVAPLLAMLRENADADPYLRHAAVVALAGIADEAALIQAAGDPSASVRLGVLLAWRRLGSERVSRFLADSDSRLQFEAARAINDVPITQALPSLANLDTAISRDPALLRRVVNANFRLGGDDHARKLATLAADKAAPDAIRTEAIDALADWAKPSGRDRVMGLWRPLAARPGAPAAQALGPIVATLLRDAPESVCQAAIRAAARLEAKQASSAIAAAFSDMARPVATRSAALQALEHLDPTTWAEAVERAVEDKDSALRAEGLRMLARIKPAAALPALRTVLDQGSIPEKQSAFGTLGGMNDPGVDVVLAQWLDRLGTGDVPPEVRLDLKQAAAARSALEIKNRLARLDAALPKDDPLARYRDALAGGDWRRGRRLFREKSELQCLRCHKIAGDGGEVGPDLTGIGKKQTSEYLLEAIVAPNRKIAEGFETVVIGTSDGQIHVGILKGDDGTNVRLMTPEGKSELVRKADIEDRKRGLSAMPEDAITRMSIVELRDLIAYLSNLK